MPQAPQFSGSVIGSMQPVAHSICDAMGQWHAPPRHVVPPTHARPHMPQCRLLVIRSAQSVPHAVAPGRQLCAWQVPLTQACPVAQAWPQVPQLFASSIKLTQLEPQRMKPVAQAPKGMHAPPEQPWPDGHTAHEAPHAVLSVSGSTQRVPHMS